MKDKIVIKGAKEHNLKNVDLEIPRNSLLVFTGVSGSGKSSLAFDTLYAEGQRRYVESLSSYARQFLGQMEKPKVDNIEGLSPAISIEQKATSKNPRSTVGTVTEIYDYLRILFARIGKQYCYNCDKEVGSQSIDQIINYVQKKMSGEKLYILAPIVQNRKGEHKEEIEEARKEGYSRIMINGQMRDLSEDIILDKKSKHNIDIIVDRLLVSEDNISRLADSLETTLKISNGLLRIFKPDTQESEILSEKNSCPECGISFEELTPQSFSFNSPIGMCPVCNGLGNIIEFDEDLIVPNKDLSILDGAVLVWKEVKNKLANYEMQMLVQLAKEYNFSLAEKWKNLPSNIQKILLYGTSDSKVNFSLKTGKGEYKFARAYEGIIPILERRMKQTVSENVKRYYLQFVGNKSCPVCKGKKLKKEFLSVYINKKSIADITAFTIEQAISFFKDLKLSGNDKKIAEDLLKEINDRLNFLMNVGLHYLTLDRKAPTLSGGESQRIRLASQVGSGLVGVMYILDEPSIGLHQRDNKALINMLVKLKNLGNTVIVVEHDEEMMRAADQIVDFGPRAGKFGGEVVAQGNISEIMKNKNSLTGKYLSKKEGITFSPKRRKNKQNLIIKGARQNNLKNIDVKIPVGLFTCITGVSGSGKSSLINQILYPDAANVLNKAQKVIGNFDKILGYEFFDKVIAIDQQPIGKTPRSNPVTYIKAFDEIRILFAKLPASKIRGYAVGRFSFNVKGGRCEACQGAGVNQIEMHFLPDIFVTCPICKGKRYNSETLAVKYKEKNIWEVLDLEVTEAYSLFENIPSIALKLKTLIDVGLDYVKIGQASNTLSGGEAQRIKLAKELSKVSTGKTLYILDEPTTGLHFDDVKKLLLVLFRLVEKGNTVVVIEHNLDVIKCADYVIDLGPEGGNEGGEIVAIGTPEQIAENPKSYTGQYLKDYLK